MSDFERLRSDQKKINKKLEVGGTCPSPVPIAGELLQLAAEREARAMYAVELYAHRQ